MLLKKHFAGEFFKSKNLSKYGIVLKPFDNHLVACFDFFTLVLSDIEKETSTLLYSLRENAKIRDIGWYHLRNSLWIVVRNGDLSARIMTINGSTGDIENNLFIPFDKNHLYGMKMIISPNDKFICVLVGDIFYVIDCRTNQIRRREADKINTNKEDDRIFSSLFHPNNDNLLYFGCSKGKIIQYSISKDSVVKIFTSTNSEFVHYICHGLSEDNLITHDGTILTVWDMKSNLVDNIDVQMPCELGYVKNCCLLHGEYIVINVFTKIQLWDIGTGKLAHEWQGKEGIREISLSKDNSTLAAIAADGSVFIFQMALRSFSLDRTLMIHG